MWTLVKNNMYSIRKVLIVANLIAVIIGAIFSFKVKDGIIMAPFWFFIASTMSISIIIMPISQNKSYNLFINNFGIKRTEIVKANMVVNFFVSIIAIILGIVFTFIINSIDNELRLNDNLGNMIILVGLMFGCIMFLFEGANYFNFKYGEDDRKHRVIIFTICAGVFPQVIRLFSNFKIFKKFTFWDLSIKNSLILSLSLCILGLLGTFAINKVSQKNYEKREF